MFSVVFTLKDLQTREPVEGRLGPFEKRGDAEAALSRFAGADRTGAVLLGAQVVDDAPPVRSVPEILAREG